METNNEPKILFQRDMGKVWETNDVVGVPELHGDLVIMVRAMEIPHDIVGRRRIEGARVISPAPLYTATPVNKLIAYLPDGWKIDRDNKEEVRERISDFAAREHVLPNALTSGLDCYIFGGAGFQVKEEDGERVRYTFQGARDWRQVLINDFHLNVWPTRPNTPQWIIDIMCEKYRNEDDDLRGFHHNPAGMSRSLEISHNGGHKYALIVPKKEDVANHTHYDKTIEEVMRELDRL